MKILGFTKVDFGNVNLRICAWRIGLRMRILRHLVTLKLPTKQNKPKLN